MKIVFILLLFTTVSYSVSFDELLNIAYKNNNQIRIGINNIEKMENKLSQVSSYHYPSVTLNSNLVKFYEPMYFKDLEMTGSATADVTMDMGSGPITIEGATMDNMNMKIDRFDLSGSWMLQNEIEIFWPIFAWFKVVNLGNAVKEGIKVEEFQLSLIKNRILKNLSTAYVQYILAIESLKVLNDTIKEMESFYKNSSKEMKEGENSNITLKDIIQIQYDLKDMKVWLPKLENMRDLSLEAIKFIINSEGIKIDIPYSKLSIVSFNMNLPAIQEIAIENRPEVKLLKAAIRAVGYQKKSEFADYLPQVGAMGKVVYRYDNFDSNQEWEFIGGIGLKWNVFNGGLTYNKIKEKESELSILNEKFKMLKSGINFEVKRTFKVFKQNEKQLTIRKNALEDAIKKLQEVKQGYQYQVSTTKDLNEAQVQKRWAEANYLFKKLDYVKSLINMNYVTGKFITNLQ